MLAELVADDAGVLAKYRRGELTSAAGADYVTYYGGQARRGSSAGNVPAAYRLVADMDTHVLEVLSKIRPEHIAQMQRLDCMEPSPLKGLAGTEDARFVVLKPGIGFRLDKGADVLAPQADPQKQYSERMRAGCEERP